MHQTFRRAMGRAAIALSCLSVVQACGATPEMPVAPSEVKSVTTVPATRRYADSVRKGLTGSSSDQSAFIALLAAAEAARRDQDPSVNGSISDELSSPSDAILSAAATAARRDTDPYLNGDALADPSGERAPVRKPTLDDAWVAYERCHWREAFTMFAELADAGESEAARMAMSMVTHGPALYQQTFDVPAKRASSWQRLGKLWATANEQATGPIALEPRH